jgi:hypothetical protein
MPVRPLTELERQNLDVLAGAAGDYALLFLTRTGLEKGLIDATQPIRTLFLEHGYHDFTTQGRGRADNGVERDAVVVGETREEPLRMSLYRPQAKPNRPGDPRLWPSRLPRFAQAGDVMALFFQGERLCLLNLTCAKLDGTACQEQNFAAGFVRAIHDARFAPVNELVGMLRKLAESGPLKAPAHDESIGFAIESALGIPRNARRTPDFKGIEIKSGRGAGSKTSLFACVPDWELCRTMNQNVAPHLRYCASHQEVLNRYGYHDGTRWALYCTVTTRSPNPQGLVLAVDAASNRLVESCNAVPPNVAVWRMETLHACLKAKHPQTLWIKARSERQGSHELFFLQHATYTFGPSVAQFDALLLEGAVTVDHRIHWQEGTPRDHGIPFRIRPERVRDLFSSEPIVYQIGT